MHNKETIIGIALFLLGDGIGGGLQMLGVVNPFVGWVIIALSSSVGIGLFVYGIKIKDNTLASQIYDADMGGHLNQIKKMLDTFKKQLVANSNKKGLLRNLGIAIEKQRGFYQVWEHCPSINKAGLDLRLSRILYEAKLKSNSVVDEDDSHIKERMKALADAIDNCLSDSEYLNHSCSNCIEKQNQLSGISKASNPALAQSKDFTILWVEDYGHFEDYTRGTDRPFLGVNSYIVFKPGRGRITVESLWLDIAGTVAETSGQWTTKTFAKEEAHNLQFGIPPDIPRGQRTVKLMAIVDGSEVVCDEFTIDLPLEK